MQLHLSHFSWYGKKLNMCFQQVPWPGTLSWNPQQMLSACVWYCLMQKKWCFCTHLGIESCKSSDPMQHILENWSWWTVHLFRRLFPSFSSWKPLGNTEHSGFHCPLCQSTSVGMTWEWSFLETQTCECRGILHWQCAVLCMCVVQNIFPVSNQIYTTLLLSYYLSSVLQTGASISTYDSK